MACAAGRRVAGVLLLAAASACSRQAGAPQESAVTAVPARSTPPIPTVALTAHDGSRVRFDELVRDRVVVIAFGYVRCTGSCPKTTASLYQVQRLLGDRAGRDVALLTITLDPEHDTPGVLARHAAEVGAGPGWRFLTAAPQDVDALRRWLGLYDRREPDAPRTSHSALVVVGDAARGRWFVLPGLGPPAEISRAALRLADGRARSLTAAR